MSFGFQPGIESAIIDAANRYGIDPTAMLAIAKIESGGDPQAQNPNSSAGGLFQFIDSTANQYGLSDRFNPAQAADAAARLARDNASHLKKVLGRDPTVGELYLAHQQGAGGAARLLRDPNARAVDVVGADAVRLNRGRSDMSAADFAQLWTQKADALAGTTSAQINQNQTRRISPSPSGNVLAVPNAVPQRPQINMLDPRDFMNQPQQNALIPIPIS